MKIEIKLVTKRAYGVFEDGNLIYQTGDVESICYFCKKHYKVEPPTTYINTPCGMKKRFERSNTPTLSFDV